MINALLTLLAALGLAFIAGWFSIAGMTAIYAGTPLCAILLGIGLESGKLVGISWLYRNWKIASWKLKLPLIYFVIALMCANGIGVFGFLSKAHIEQNSSTINNADKILRLDEQIAREKSTIEDDQKVITQLDNTINSYLGKDRTDKSLAVRKSQAPQRQQLRTDIDAAQKRIDDYSNQKLELQSEVKKQQLDVGPIRYIAELFYGVGNTDQNIESAVRLFTLLIVSVLDPFAVTLLIAANATILRIQDEEKNKKKYSNEKDSKEIPKDKNEYRINGEKNDKIRDSLSETINKEILDPEIHLPLSQEFVEIKDEKETANEKNNEEISRDNTRKLVAQGKSQIDIIKEEIKKGRIQNVGGEVTVFSPEVKVSNDEGEIKKEIIDKISQNVSKMDIESVEILPSAADNIATNYKNIEENLLSKEKSENKTQEPAVELSPKERGPWAAQPAVLRGIIGNTPHFVPRKVNEEEKSESSVQQTYEEKLYKSSVLSEENKDKNDAPQTKKKNSSTEEDNGTEAIQTNILPAKIVINNKYPKVLNWLQEFKGA